MEVPIQLQQITSSTLMSSAVAIICVILRAVWKYFTGITQYVYTLGLIYIYLGLGGWESFRCLNVPYYTIEAMTKL